MPITEHLGHILHPVSPSWMSHERVVIIGIELPITTHALAVGHSGDKVREALFECHALMLLSIHAPAHAHAIPSIIVPIPSAEMEHMAIFMGDDGPLHPMFFTLNHHLVWTPGRANLAVRLEG